MTHPVSRRRLIELALAAGGMASLPMGAATALGQVAAPGSNPMFPDRFLKVLGFFPEDRDWYETIHAPDFMSFAAPHMARYARNWIKDVEMGEAPAFSVITEIHYRNDAAKNDVRRLMGSPAGEPMRTHLISHRAAAGKAAPPAASPAPPSLFSVEPLALAGRASATGPATLRRRVLLLRRSSDAGQGAFQAAAIAMARAIARTGSGTAVSLDLFAPAQAGPADAVIYVANSAAAALPTSGHKALQVLSVLGVETRSSVG